MRKDITASPAVNKAPSCQQGAGISCYSKLAGVVTESEHAESEEISLLLSLVLHKGRMYMYKKLVQLKENCKPLSYSISKSTLHLYMQSTPCITKSMENLLAGDSELQCNLFCE
jgi:hypothetical protein